MGKEFLRRASWTKALSSTVVVAFLCAYGVFCFVMQLVPAPQPANVTWIDPNTTIGWLADPWREEPPRAI